MKLSFDRSLDIGAIVLTIIFGILSLLPSTTWLQSLLIVFTAILLVISIVLIFKGEEAREAIRHFTFKKRAKISYKILKKVGITRKPINYCKICKDKKKVIKYGYSRFQDTILPLFFDYVHRRALYRYGLTIEFVQIPWNGHCRAFEDNLVDVSLSNFSSLLTFYASLMVEDSKEATKIREKTPSTFFPFFEFRGHGIFIRTQLLDKISQQSRREEIQNGIFNERRSFFEIITDPRERKKLTAEMFSGARVGYEAGTDLEATINTLLLIMEINRNLIEPKWEDTRLGYTKFLAGEWDVYCGGLVEAFSLYKKFDDKKESIDFFPYCTGKDLNVISPNGLITTQAFLSKHFIIFRELIETWFWSINQFKTDIMNADKSLIENIISFLNTSLRKTSSGEAELSLSKELLDWMVNRGFEHFYTDPLEAFTKYYSDSRCGLLSSSFTFALLAPPETSFETVKTEFNRIGPIDLANSLRTIVLNESKKFLPEFHLGYATLQC